MASNISKRIDNDPAFERTRENMAEFERAANAGKLLNDSFRVLSGRSGDRKLTQRLSAKMYKVLKEDKVNDRGMRTVAEGNLQLLRGFEFNNIGKLSTVLFTPYTASIDRVAGTLNISIPDFVPQTVMKAPQGTTHFAIVSAASELDFANGLQNGVNTETAPLVYGSQTEPAITLNNALTANSTRPLFLALGVKYFQETNGKYYPLNTGRFNPLSIVQVDVAA
ncbi:hypothetical protein F0L74_27205 [Chitinophaga agrisoli]|uniref:Uncharacterized protein n=1 Tax=Chitinophaga agrisoli TaxID=2607653 RepID=A0A5B2VNV5_9BACT|nr:hypothetical protein [Chitinophaga agrisoli]KAA2239877.1 hypothetical protein F0L74_27205 [Chitinophaga agrisoli]